MKSSYKILSIIVIVSVWVATSIIFLFRPPPCPAWILAEKSVSQDNVSNYIVIYEEEVMHFPQLISAIIQADDALRVDPNTGSVTHRIPPGPMIKMEHENAISLLEYLGSEYRKKTDNYHFNIIMNDSLYNLQMIFNYKPPIQG